jgi:hypothetical protein
MRWRRSARQRVAKQSWPWTGRPESIDHIPKGNPGGRLPFEWRCPSNRKGPDAGLGGWVLRRGHLGGTSQSSQQRSVRADHIPFSGAVLFCSLFQFATGRIGVRAGPPGMISGGPKVTPGAQPRSSCSVGAAGGVTALSRLERAVTSCAGAKGLPSITLFGTPMEAHSSPWAPVM